MRVSCMGFMVALACFVAAVAADQEKPGASATCFVAPNGNDAWSGNFAGPNAEGTDGPFATLGKAVAATQALPAGTPKRIVIQPGQYLVEQPVIVSEPDSGLAIEAAEGARPMLIGGRRVAGWQQDGDHLWSANLPDVKEGTWDFRCLVVNGRYCLRARLPKEGSFEHMTEFTVRWMGTTGGGWERKPTPEELTTMTYRPEDLPADLDIKNAEITVYHMWDESMVGVTAHNAAVHTLTFSTPATHPPGAFNVKKYIVWNVKEGMTKPGQWYLDRTAGKVVYWPLPGQDMAAAEVFAPTTESILKIQGTEKNPVRNVTVQGLSFSVTNTPLKSGGFGAGAFEGAVVAYHTESSALVNLEMVNVGGQGLKTWKLNNSRVERCVAHGTGACGLKAEGDNTEVADNLVYNVGLSYPSAIGLWGGGNGVHIHHNTVHDTPYSAIICGADNCIIESNHIYAAMKELHDGAGIYVSGRKNMTLRGNFVHDIIDTGGYGASAYYLDEQSEGCTVEGNLSVGVRMPTHNHWAKGNTIRNNVFVVDGDATLSFARSADYVFERNVVWATGSITVSNDDVLIGFSNNVFFSQSGKVFARKLNQYKETAIQDLQMRDGSVIADPLLLEYKSGLVRFGEQSPVVGLGVAPVDVRAAGVRTTPGQ